MKSAVTPASKPRRSYHCSASDPCLADKRAQHETGGNAGLSAEDHEAKAPALSRRQGSRAPTAARRRRKREAAYVVVIGSGLPMISRCWRRTANASAAKPARHSAKAQQMAHRAPSLGRDGDRSLPSGLALGPGRRAACRAVRIAKARHGAKPAPSTSCRCRRRPSRLRRRLCHSGRCVVSAFRTGSRNSSADAVHNCSTQAAFAGRSEGMQQRQGPDDEERVNLPVGAALQRMRQQAVGPQECRHGDRQAGDARDVQPLDQTEAEIGTIRVCAASAAASRSTSRGPSPPWPYPRS